MLSTVNDANNFTRILSLAQQETDLIKIHKFKHAAQREKNSWEKKDYVNLAKATF